MCQDKIDEKLDLDGIISRFRQSFGFALDKDVAQVLGISAQDYHHRKKRGTLLTLLIKYAVDQNVNLHWLLTGEGVPYADKTEAKIEEVAPRAEINAEILALVIKHVELWLDDNKRELDPAKKSEVIIFLYEQCMELGRTDKQTVDKLLRLVA